MGTGKLQHGEQWGFWTTSNKVHPHSGMSGMKSSSVAAITRQAAENQNSTLWLRPDQQQQATLQHQPASAPVPRKDAGRKKIFDDNC